MKVDGAYLFDISAEQLWKSLMDPKVVAACIPGIREFTQTAPDNYEVALRVGVGAISGTYEATLEITDAVEPVTYRMSVEGQGARTTIKGSGTMTLAEVDKGTELRFVGEAQVTGMLARVGQRLMGSVSKVLIDQFFDCVKSKTTSKIT